MSTLSSESANAAPIVMKGKSERDRFVRGDYELIIEPGRCLLSLKHRYDRTNSDHQFASNPVFCAA